MIRTRRKRGRHLRTYPLYHENEIKAAINEEAKRRMGGHYSGYLSNGDEYQVDLTVGEFELDLELIIS